MIRIVAIEDDLEALEVVVNCLEEDGLLVSGFATARAALEADELRDAAMVVTDLLLPDSNGFDILRSLTRQSEVPLLVISGRSDTASRVAALELGADDFLAKPFELAELRARVRAILRRVKRNGAAKPASKDKMESIGSVMFDLARREMQGPKGKAQLTSAESAILETLIRLNSGIATRAILADATGHSTWSEDERSIDVHISNLRRKLKDIGAEGLALRTVRGAGYLLQAEEA